jgi:hypothetical protein
LDVPGSFAEDVVAVEPILLAHGGAEFYVDAVLTAFDLKPPVLLGGVPGLLAQGGEVVYVTVVAALLAQGGEVV